MTGRLFKALLAACFSVAMLGASCARAADGRITFTGAVVEPTCTTGGEDEGLQSPVIKPRRRACGSATDIAAGSAASYVLVVAVLNKPDSTDDRLLNYFLGYLPPLARSDAKLIIRTYE